MLTVSEYFDSIAQNYGTLSDYMADVTMVQDEEVWSGVLSYKNPNLLRINFSEPSEMVIASDGELLTVYYPEYSAVFEQELKGRSPSQLGAMANEEGLKLMKKNYSMQYLSGPDPLPLGEGIEGDPSGAGDEMVTKLRLTSRSTEEGFRHLDISISKNGFIRRIIGITVGYEQIQFDFENIRINQNIPDARFEFDSPPSANVFKNFLGFNTQS